MAAKDCDSCALGSMAVAARGCSEVAVWLSRLSVSLDCGDDDISSRDLVLSDARSRADENLRDRLGFDNPPAKYLLTNTSCRWFSSAFLYPEDPGS